jgi:hypothetical protein
MSSISPELKSKLQRDPRATIHLIVRLKDNPSVHLTDIASRGFAVRRTFALISAIAIEGKAAPALALAKESWVLSIEEDKPVRTMPAKQGRDNPDA